MKVLVTGGCGFIGSNFIHLLLRSGTSYEVTNIDNLSYAGNPENLKQIDIDPRYRFQRLDIADREGVDRLLSSGRFDAIVNFAAESHVDRSIEDAGSFVQTNIVGTQVLLEAARRGGVGRFLQISTDEVYGSLGEEGKFVEETPLAPNSPYAASKAAADLLLRSYWETYRYPCLITRCSNNYGPYQFPEKFVPLMITNALQGKPVPIYGDGLYTRDWIQVEDHCAALELVLRKGKPGGIYNIGASCEKRNLEVVREILAILGRPESLIEHVTDRPGHDRRYAIDATKIRREFGWTPGHTMEEGLRATVAWYRANETWWRRIVSGDYLVDRKTAQTRPVP